MGELEPERVEILAFYRRYLGEHTKIADDCRIPHFTRDLQHSLECLLGVSDAVQLLESATRIGDFGNSEQLKRLDKTVSRELQKRGVKQRRGKRPGAGLRELVSCLTPLMLYFGVHLATSERSKLVEALREIASEVGVCGDPRDELRRLRRLERNSKKVLQKDILTAVTNGLAVFKSIQPPVNISLPC